MDDEEYNPAKMKPRAALSTGSGRVAERERGADEESSEPEPEADEPTSDDEAAAQLLSRPTPGAGNLPPRPFQEPNSALYSSVRDPRRRPWLRMLPRPRAAPDPGTTADLMQARAIASALAEFGIGPARWSAASDHQTAAVVVLRVNTPRGLSRGVHQLACRADRLRGLRSCWVDRPGQGGLV